jgi:hypothetical protein
LENLRKKEKEKWRQQYCRSATTAQQTPPALSSSCSVARKQNK